MRPIRFRAWHKLAHKMAVVDMLDFMLDAYRAHAGKSSGSGHLADIELMEFTGLYDKHGKEICEGDIVEYLDNTSQGLVKKIVVISDIRHLPDFGCSKWEEIIGNIYEHNDDIKRLLEEL
jgi:uncharacterized phage protein (TIGR01671 family)